MGTTFYKNLRIQQPPQRKKGESTIKYIARLLSEKHINPLDATNLIAILLEKESTVICENIFKKKSPKNLFTKTRQKEF